MPKKAKPKNLLLSSLPLLLLTVSFLFLTSYFLLNKFSPRSPVSSGEVSGVQSLSPLTQCKTSSKKGVGGGPWDDRGIARDQMNTIGASWYYNWQYWNYYNYYQTGVELVPMIRYRYNSSYVLFDRNTQKLTSFGESTVQTTVSANRLGTGLYWLVGNEPDHPNEDNLLNKADQARVYRNISQEIKRYDPQAKIIVGGWASPNGNWRQLDVFKKEWKNSAGQSSLCQEIAGFHFHHYPDDNSKKYLNNFNAFYKYIHDFASYLKWEICPDKEMEVWLTETGDMFTYNYELNDLKQFANWLIPKLEEDSSFDRYAWYKLAGECDNLNFTRSENRIYCHQRGTTPVLTDLGNTYRSLGSSNCSLTSVTPTRRPTTTITPTATISPTSTPTLPSSTPSPPVSTPASGQCLSSCESSSDCQSGLVCAYRYNSSDPSLSGRRCRHPLCQDRRDCLCNW